MITARGLPQIVATKLSHRHVAHKHPDPTPGVATPEPGQTCLATNPHTPELC